MSSQAPHLSRALLFPGPLAPISHFGLTLSRHLVAMALRYALYQLGLPLPDKPPLRLIRLRPYLDARALRLALEEHPAGEEVAAAIIDPGGESDSEAALAPLLGARLFHRARLARFRRPAADAPVVPGASPEGLWRELRSEIARSSKILGDACLAEILASLARRAARARGRERPPCLSRDAWRLTQGRRPHLHLFGPPDLLSASWAAHPTRARQACVELSARDGIAPHPLRGRFRLVYRGVLDRLRPTYLALASDAVRRGLLEDAEDAFFIPFDLGEDLALESAPAWLPSAVASNRAELRKMAVTGAPLELQRGKQEMTDGPNPQAELACAPLSPLP